MQGMIRKKISRILCVVLILALLEKLCPPGVCMAEGKVINISSAEDLLAAQDYLEEHSGWVIFNQTCDIGISPYTYDYKQDGNRIEISYQGDVEAYYDVEDGGYYSSLTATGAAIDYQWKTSSWTPLGSGGASCSYTYRGNGHAIEGVYQRKTSLNKVTDTGLFYGAGSVENVVIKNYFGIGKNLEKLSILGNDIREIEGCRTENTQLVTVNDSSPTNAGFVGELCTDISNVTVNANIFSVNTTGADGERQYMGNNLGLIAGEQTKSVDIENCHTSGIIGSEKEEAYAVGGLVGCVEFYEDAPGRIRSCTSDALLNGSFLSVGGIAGLIYYDGPDAGFAIENCRFHGNVRKSKSSYDNDVSFGYAGGICGFQESGVINACVNEGSIEGYYGYYGGITGNIEGGEILNCINEGAVTGGCDDRLFWGGQLSHEEGDFLAGGIVGYIFHRTGMFRKGISVLNCGNRGEVSSKSGPAAGVAAYQKGSASEISNVWNITEVKGAVEADSVTGTWISGSREHCIDGKESTPEELCESLNRWIATADMDEHFTLGGFDTLSEWEVADGKLQLHRALESTAGPTPTQKIITAAPKPTKTAGVKQTRTPAPTGTAAVNRTQTPVPTGTAGGNAGQTKAPVGTASPEPVQTPEETAPAGERTPPIPAATDPAGAGTTQTPGAAGASSAKPAGTAKPSKPQKAPAPVFTLSRKKNKENQAYIQVKIKKHYGDYVEVWAKIEKGSYRKLKLTQNRLPVLKNKLRFKYTISGKTFYFKLRTYKLKKGKKIYSKMSSGKGIVTK